MAQPAAAPAEDNPRNSRIYIDIPLGPRRDAVVTEKGFQIRSPHAYFLYAGEGQNPIAVEYTRDISSPTTHKAPSYLRPSPNTRIWIAGVPYSVDILADFQGPDSQKIAPQRVQEIETPHWLVHNFFNSVHNADRAPRSEINMRYIFGQKCGESSRVLSLTDNTLSELVEQALAKARAELEIDRVFLVYQTALARFGSQTPSAQQTLENYLSFGG